MKCLFFLLVIFTVGYSAMKYPRCPPNEIFRECGTACEPNCQDPTPTICTLQCITNVCQCARGFVRGPAGCVRFSQCPVYGK